MKHESSFNCTIDRKIGKMSMHTKAKIVDQHRGPGSYNPCLISTSAPAFSMGSRIKTKDSEMWQRGPGSYDLREPKRGPSFTLGVRESTKKNNQSSIPGPGAYNTDKSRFIKNSAPAYSMGGRITTNNSISQSPGPGAYNIDSGSKSTSGLVYNMSSKVYDSITNSGNLFSQSTIKSTPAFSFGGRSKSRVDNTPGPGSYNVDVGNLKKGGPAYSIACHENRFKGTKGSSPGPGAYNISSIGRSAPSYTIAQKCQESFIA